MLQFFSIVEGFASQNPKIDLGETHSVLSCVEEIQDRYDLPTLHKTYHDASVEFHKIILDFLPDSRRKEYLQHKARVTNLMEEFQALISEENTDYCGSC